MCDRISYQEKAFQNLLVTLGQVAKGIPSPKECLGALACEMIGEPVEPWSPSNKAMMMLVSNSDLQLAGIHAFAFFFNRLSHLLSPCLRRAKSWSLTQVAIIGRPVFLGSIDPGRLWRAKPVLGMLLILMAETTSFGRRSEPELILMSREVPSRIALPFQSPIRWPTAHGGSSASL